MSATYERFYRAVGILAGPGTLQERLASAYRSEIQYVEPQVLPSDIARVELVTIKDELTKIDSSGEKDAIDMSAGILSDAEADELAIEILDIYDELAKLEH